MQEYGVVGEQQNANAAHPVSGWIVNGEGGGGVQGGGPESRDANGRILPCRSAFPPRPAPCHLGRMIRSWTMAFRFDGKESHLGFEGGKGKGDQRVGGKGVGVRGPVAFHGKATLVPHHCVTSMLNVSADMTNS